MDYRHDFLREKQDVTGDTYERISERAGLSKNTVYLVIQGKTNPTASTLRATFQAVGVDPKYAFDFKLRRSDFRRAVVEAAR
jgi:transcriptional regulator with XRE-family HTH domain